ncbi:dnaJ homolog subfamily C member 14 [Carica papaya]|uniref:dnaJ homolog subfamily C member 14 n=1 Tax=Carica papaya TaxID=3649 RepID=UPI000B8CCE3D|nr:dnaJ homolog subfamily C member 14 [Carica papaya]
MRFYPTSSPFSPCPNTTKKNKEQKKNKKVGRGDKGTKMEESSNRVEAERLLGIAEKQLQTRDLQGSKEFAVLAQETEPLLEGSDQILAVVEVLLASEKRINNHHDWYAMLQLERRSDDFDQIKKQYRKLALLLHPDKNKFPFADQAFKLVAEAWSVLSNESKKALYDNELSLFTKVDLNSLAGAGLHQHDKLPVRRSQRETKPAEDEFRSKLSTFWTACPYCYRLYEYPRVYLECCLRCQNCQRAFQATMIPSLPPLVPGKDAYYCRWGFFPLGFVTGNSDNGGGKGATTSRFPNWMPPIYSPDLHPAGNNFTGVAATATAAAPAPAAAAAERVNGTVNRGNSAVNERGSSPRKRGRPRKNPGF